MIDLDELEILLTTGSPVPWECEDDGKTKKIASSDALIACALRNAAPELIAMARQYQWLRDAEFWPVNLHGHPDLAAAIDDAMQEQKR